jgi:hypothetical protein
VAQTFGAASATPSAASSGSNLKAPGFAGGYLLAEGKAAGHPRSALDMIVAAIAGANGCVIVTDNEKDFAGLRMVNPMRDGASKVEL